MPKFAAALGAAFLMPAPLVSNETIRAIGRVLTLLAALIVFVPLLTLAVAAPAYAQESPIDGKVVFAWGDLVAQLLLSGGVVYAAVLGFINRHVPEQWRVNEVFGKAVDYGFSVAQGAVKGKTVDIRTGSQVVELALQYLVDLAPGLLTKYGPTKARAMLVARIPFDEAATPSVLGPNPSPPLGNVIP